MYHTITECYGMYTISKKSLKKSCRGQLFEFITEKYIPHINMQKIFINIQNTLNYCLLISIVLSKVSSIYNNCTDSVNIKK